MHENVGQCGIFYLKDTALAVSFTLKATQNFPKAGIFEKMIYGRWLETYKVIKKQSPGLPHKNSSYENEKIAIIGMSCRFPKANNLSEFWKLLIEAKDGTSVPPVGRWTEKKSDHYFEESEKVNAGFLSVPEDDFDSKFFGISPKDAEFMDPQLRILMELVWEGLEHAGINPENLKGTNGSVFLGTWKNDYKEIVQRVSYDVIRTVVGTTTGAMVARIAHWLGLQGPCFGTESDCAAGIVAVNMACNSLRKRDSNLAFACGANLLLKPFNRNTVFHLLSEVGKCKSFDESADGFGRADGCAVLVLKRHSDAVRDGDQIWGLIRGSAVVQEGLSKSIGTPTVSCEAEVIKAALQEANVAPSEISYVEAHGTGTALGDPIEIKAIEQAYGNCTRKEKLIIGSVKSNIGHTESCSGITGIIKVILCMWNEQIPPQINLKKLNHKIQLDLIPAVIPLQAVSWKKTLEKPRVAGISSFGIAGTDTHLILEEPNTIDPNPQKLIFQNFKRPLHIMQISAKTNASLNILLEKFQTTFSSIHQDDSRENETFANLAYTSNVGRAPLLFKATVIAKDVAAAVNNLKSGKYLRTNQSMDLETNPKICFIFTGYGAQYYGIARQLFDTCPVFRIHVDYCDTFLQNNYNFSFAEIYFGKITKCTNSQRTMYSLIEMIVLQYALWKLWESWGIKPNLVLGHSLGEYSAAVCAGMMDITHVLRFIIEMCELPHPEGKMLVVKKNKRDVEKLQKKFGSELDYAAINTNEQTVLTGDTSTVKDFATFLKKSGIKHIYLQTPIPVHSKLMDPFLKDHRRLADKFCYKRPKENCQFISAMLGKVVDEINADYWARQTRETVNFLDASKLACKEMNCKIFLEIGPSPVLSTFVVMNNAEEMKNILCVPSLRKTEEDWETLLNSVGRLVVEAGIQMDWEGFDSFYKRSKIGHLLPSYPFQRTKCWITQNQDATKDSVKISPLLGSILSNPTDSLIFQNHLILSKLPYLRDHFQNFVLFPGAGYMEMLLSACYLRAYGISKSFLPMRAITLQNFKIFAPLAINEDDKGTTVQVLVDSNSTNISAKVYHHEKYQDNWILHASGQFSFYNIQDHVTDLETETLLLSKEKASVVKFFNKIKSVCFNEKGDSNIIQNIYRKQLQLGYKFGPLFQLLSKAWQSEEHFLTEVSLSTLKSSSDFNSSSNFLHPTLTDAMIQVAICSNNDYSKFQAPVGCSEYIWFNQLNCQSIENCYIYTNTSYEVRSASLFDDEGSLIAAVIGIETASTNIGAIKASCQSQVKPLPDFYRTEWSQDLMLNGVTLPLESNGLQHIKEGVSFTLACVKPAFDLPVVEQDYLVFLYVLKTFFKLNWSPSIGNQFGLNDLLNELKVSHLHTKLLFHYLTYLCEEGILQNIAKNTWVVQKLPLSEQNVDKEIASLIRKLGSAVKLSKYVLMEKIQNILAHVLRGKETVREILFPRDSQLNSIGVSNLYEDIFNELPLSTVFQNHFKSFPASSIEPPPKLRILEVGAGTGTITKIILESLETVGISYEYLFTDISPSFFSSGKKRFANYRKSMKYQKLDLEFDPYSQGFPPKYFDIIVAAHVVHATKDIKKTLEKIRGMLRDGGTLFLTENIGVHRISDFIVGTLEGFWLFTDTDLRPDYPMLQINQWETVLKQSEFNDMEYIVEDKFVIIVTRADTKKYTTFGSIGKNNRLAHDTPLSPHWMIFHPGGSNQVASEFLESIKIHFGNLGRKTILNIFDLLTKSDISKFFDNYLFKCQCTIEGIIYFAGGTEETNQNLIAKPFLYLLQNLISLHLKDINLKCILLTDCQLPVRDSICHNPSASTLIGMGKTFLNEHADIKFKMIDINMQEMNPEWVFQEIIKWTEEDPTYLCAIRGDSVYTPKLFKYKPFPDELTISNAGESYQMILPESKTIQDLTFGPLETHSLQPLEIEIEVKAFSLNFKDLLSIWKPTTEFENCNIVGMDFAGVVCRVGIDVKLRNVGEFVFGINRKHKALPSHIKVLEKEVLPIPNNMTFVEASQFPAVFCTAYHCLVELAKVKKGETVLIHTASGGVGLIAIQMAKRLGLQIICTAGSQRKRAYVRSQGIQNVFDSRSTKFSKEILEVTNGKGVNVVINTITGPGFKEATLAACGNGARFVEISKLNIWKKSDVGKIRPDLKYFIVDISEICSDAKLLEFFRELDEWVHGGHLKPIPYTVFKAGRIREALRFLQSAKHIGKVTITMPELRFQNAISQSNKIFNEKSTYLISGGLGEIGTEVCKYMASQGARHFVLVGRNPPKEKSKEVFKNLEENLNCQIHVSQGDIGNFSKCEEIIKWIETVKVLPPLRGVMHVAGTLSDGILENLAWENFQTTFNPKVDGSWNLHELTKHLVLEHFVLFSSIMAHYGLAGHANHCSACSFQDSFAHFRNSQGYSTININWGQWAEIGTGTEANLLFMKPFSPQQGINALDKIIRENCNDMTVQNIYQHLAPNQKYINWFINSNEIFNSSDAITAVESKTDEESLLFWENYNSCNKDETKKLEVIKNSLISSISHFLHLQADDQVGETTTLEIMGMDSLMILEFQNVLQTLFGKKIKLPSGILRDHDTVNKLALKIFQIIEAK